MKCAKCGANKWCNSPDGDARCEGCGKMYTWKQFQRLGKK